jgi:hypothetical protein
VGTDGRGGIAPPDEVSGMNPYEDRDEGPPVEGHEKRRVLLTSRWIAAVALVLLGITALAAVSVAITTRQLVIEQKRETCYERFSWLNGSSDIDDTMPEENTLDARARHAKRCDGDRPLTQYDKR